MCVFFSIKLYRVLALWTRNMIFLLLLKFLLTYFLYLSIRKDCLKQSTMFIWRIKIRIQKKNPLIKIVPCSSKYQHPVHLSNYLKTLPMLFTSEAIKLYIQKIKELPNFIKSSFIINRKWFSTRHPSDYISKFISR